MTTATPAAAPAAAATPGAHPRSCSLPPQVPGTPLRDGRGHPSTSRPSMPRRTFRPDRRFPLVDAGRVCPEDVRRDTACLADC